MKKIYTLFSLLAISTLSVAQTTENTTELPVNEKHAMERSNSHNNAPALNGGSRVDIYTQDFAGMLPSDWTEFTESGPCSWEWTDVGHQGDYPSQPLESTTADNGWMILDSDLCGAELGDIEVAFLESPSIDCSEYDAVSVRFEQYFRRYGPAEEVTTLEVSTDGGSEWISFLFNEDIEQDGTPNPDVAQLNITDIAAGESDVRFRFRWEGVWGYGWQIDDFAVIVPVENDITLSNVDYQEAWVSADEDNLRDLPYSVYPQSQVRDLTFRGSITNNGGMGQTNVRLQVEIAGPNDYSATLTSDPVNLDPAAEASFTIPDYTPPTDIGEYSITFTALQDEEDENEDDNIGSSAFSVSDAVYARDRGIAEGEFTNFDDDYKLGTMFYMEVEEELHCIGVALSTSSAEGTAFNMELLDGVDLNYLTETELVSVPAVDELNEPGDSKWLWANLTEAPVLTAGTDYCVALNHFGGEDLVILRLSGTSPAQTSFIYEGSESTWYYVTSTPMVRMGLSPQYCSAIGMEETEMVTNHQLFPNPTSGQTTLEYSLLETANVNILVFDQQGRIAFEDTKGTQSVGEYRYNYDLSDLASGMYTLSIMVGDKAINKKLVIK